MMLGMNGNNMRIKFKLSTIWFFLWFLLLSQLHIPLNAQTNVSGDITTNTTWTLSGSPYYLVGNVRVRKNAILTIESGVKVYLQNKTFYVGYYSVSESGSLQASGVTFYGGGTLQFEYNASGSLSNCSFNNATVIFANTSEPSVTNCVFDANTSVYIQSGRVIPKLGDNTFLSGKIYLGHASWTRLDIDVSGTLKNYPNTSYYLANDVRIRNNAILTIESGVKVYLQNKTFYVGYYSYSESGSLQASGVTFYGGGTLQFEYNASGSLSNCSFNNATVIFANTSEPSVTNCVFDANTSVYIQSGRVIPKLGDNTFLSGKIYLGHASWTRLDIDVSGTLKNYPNTSYYLANDVRIRNNAILTIESGVKVYLQNKTFYVGYYAYSESGSLQASGVTFYGGGTLQFEYNASGSLSNCSFNNATVIFANTSEPSVTNCVFDANTSVYIQSGRVIPKLGDNTFLSGKIYLGHASWTRLDIDVSGTLKNYPNTSYYLANDVRIRNNAILTIESGVKVYLQNKTFYVGYYAYSESGSLQASGVTFYGGGTLQFEYNASGSLSNCSFNNATVIFANTSEPSVTNCVFDANTSVYIQSGRVIPKLGDNTFLSGKIYLGHASWTRLDIDVSGTLKNYPNTSYYLANDVRIRNNAILTIESGVKVYLQNKTFYVGYNAYSESGSLQASGVTFYGGGTLQFEYNASGSLSNCSFNNATVIFANTSEPSVTNCVFDANTSVYIQSGRVIPKLGDNTFLSGKIYLGHASWTRLDIDVSGTLKNYPNTSYYLANDVRIRKNAILTIESGIKVYLQNKTFYVGYYGYSESGSLQASGVTFYGGGTLQFEYNASGSLSNCSFNNATVIFANTSEPSVTNCVFDANTSVYIQSGRVIPKLGDNTFLSGKIYLGHASWTRLDIDVSGTLKNYPNTSYYLANDVRIRNNAILTIESGVKVYLQNKTFYVGYYAYSESGSLQASGVTFYGGGTLQFEYNASGSLSNCDFAYSLKIKGENQSTVTITLSNIDSSCSIENNSSITMNARYNYWGHPTGPQHSTNPGGQGARISDKVDFMPFMSSPIRMSYPPQIPIVILPMNNAIVSQIPIFKLKTVDPDNDEVMYIIELKQGSISKTLWTGYYPSGVEVTYSDSRQPLSDGQWQWRAKARDKRGAESGWSEWKTFTVQSNLPDLVPIDLKVTPDTVRLGNKVTVSFKVLNQGKKRANASKTRIILSKSASEPSSSDPLLKELSTPALDPNKSQDYSESVVIPADIQTGDYYVWVVVDVDKTSGQGDDTNDKAKFPIKVQEKLDYDVLVVEEVVRKKGGKEIIEEKPVAGARIIVFDENHNIITEGKTNREGKAKIPALKVGHYIRAEKYITTFYLNDKNEAVEQKTNRKFYDVYLTSDEVANSGFIFNEVKALPVKLVIRKHNALIKFHLELAFEWDADAETRNFWIAALRHASNLLYDATDGHVCIGSVKVLNNYRYPTPYGEYTGVPRNAIQVFADNDIRAHVYVGFSGVHIGRMWITHTKGKWIIIGNEKWDGNWMKIQPEFLGSVLAHEFGHSLLLLHDEYDDKTGDPKCVEPEIDQKDKYGHHNDPESKIACLMAGPWDVDMNRHVSSYSLDGASLFGEAWIKASELCHKNRHTYEGLDCWSIFKNYFLDRTGQERWILRSPVDRGVEYVPGPVFVKSYTKSGKGRLIDIGSQKDNIGKEMEVIFNPSEWKFATKNSRILHIKELFRISQRRMRVGIYSQGKFIYQGHTYNPSTSIIGILGEIIEIEGWHEGDKIEVFSANSYYFGSWPSDDKIVSLPGKYQDEYNGRIRVNEVNKNLMVEFYAKDSNPNLDLRVQLVVQNGKVLDIRDLKLTSKGEGKWEGVILLNPNEPTRGYFRISLKDEKYKIDNVVAWTHFGDYNVNKPPFPIVGGAGRLRLMNGFGFLEAPNATSDAKIFFVVTPPFVFNQSDLIPRSYAYDFKVLSGNLGNDSRLELVFEPIEATNPKRLGVYQFSEEKQEWEPIDAEIDLEEGIIVISPARSGTFALMEVAEKPPSFTFPSGLQMIGIPFRPSRSAPSEVLNLGSGEIKLARWKPKEGRYAFYRPNEQEQDEEVAKVVPGKGYWVLFDKPVSIVQQGGLIPEEGVTIPLVAGWNQISNPFIKPIEWSLSEFYVSKDGEVKSLEEARQAGWIEDYAWGWEQDANNPNTGRYVLVYDTSIIPGVKGQLEPWKGYWVYAHTDCELILPPPSQNKGRGTRGEGRVAKGNGWSMRLQASVNGSVGEAVIGIANGTRGLTVGLPPEPPTGNNGVQVILLKNNTPLAVDVRSDGSRRQEWEVW
jgi:hypothetical protein